MPEVQKKSLGDGQKSGVSVFQKGFTLLELLIAMTMLVLIVTISMGALRMASRSLAAGDRRAEAQERFRTVMTVMDAQIQSQLPLTYEAPGGKTNYFLGGRTNLRIMTNYSIWGGRMGYFLVDYQVGDDDTGKRTLKAFEQVPGMEQKREVGLFMGASDIFFEYYRRDPAEARGTWSDQWTDGTAFPEAIRLNVSYGARKNIFFFPVRARGEISAVAMTPPVAGGLKK